MVKVKSSRLMVLIVGILIPVLILIYYFSYDFTVPWFPDGQTKSILLNWVAPIIFTVSWIYMIIIFANRLAASIEIMDETSSVIPMRFKLFYGLNALFILLIYALPLITPIISAFAFMSMMFRLITARKNWENEKEKISTPIKIITFIAALPSLVVSIMVIPELIQLSSYLWNTWWLPLIEPLYNFSMAFATALSVGALIYLLRTGVAEYEQSVYVGEQRSFIQGVILLEVILTAFIIMLQYYQITFLQIFYWVGFLITVFTWIVNYIKGRGKIQDFKSYFFGYLLTVLFLGANAAFMIQYPFVMNLLGPIADFIPTADVLRTAIVIISGVAYIIVYGLVFIGHPDLEDSPSTSD